MQKELFKIWKRRAQTQMDQVFRQRRERKSLNQIGLMLFQGFLIKRLKKMEKASILI
jgi:hypothetical protein